MIVHLLDALRPPKTFAYYIGWRMASEILKLTWNQGDFERGTVRLEAHTTENDDARPIYLPQMLLDVLEQQRKEHLERYPDCQYVFHRSGKQIMNCHKTRSIFEGYNIVSDGDRKEAIWKLETAMTLQTTTLLTTIPDTRPANPLN